MEGLLWRSVRGAGLAYGANIYTDVERGFTYFNVYRSPDSVKAYIAAKKAVEAMVAGDLVGVASVSGIDVFAVTDSPLVFPDAARPAAT